MTAHIRRSQPARLGRSPAARQSRAGRTVGCVVGAVVNATMLWMVNERPGWQAVPFLTPDTRLVLGLVNASLVVGVLSNLVSAAVDAPRMRALADLAQNAVGAAALVRIWQVFPFDFGTGGFDWALLAKWAVGVGVFGAVIGMVVALSAWCVAADRSSLLHSGGGAGRRRLTARQAAPARPNLAWETRHEEDR